MEVYVHASSPECRTKS